MKIISLTLILSLVLITNTNAQDQPALRLNLQGYNVIFPGVEIAYQHPIFKRTLNQSKQNKFILNLAPVFDFYHYKGNHTGIGLTGEMNLQIISKKGFISELYGGYGLLGSILSGEVYELNDQDRFESNNLKGNVYTNWKVGFGFAKRCSFKSGKILYLNFRAGIRHAKTPGAFVTPIFNLGVNFLLNQKKKE